MTTEKPSPFCDKCGQNKNLAHIARAQESAYQSLLEQAEAMERALEEITDKYCSGHITNCTVETQHKTLEQFREFKEKAGL